MPNVLTTKHSLPFWERKALADMTQSEWESLCDGCGRCCLVLLEDVEAEPDEPEARFFETSVCCELFDPKTRRCTNYKQRAQLVPGCVTLAPDTAKTLEWMPESCAYRRLAEGRGLADWHPLVSGQRDSVVEAGVAVSTDLVNEKTVSTDELWKFVTRARNPYTDT